MLLFIQVAFILEGHGSFTLQKPKGPGTPQSVTLTTSAIV